VPGSFRAVGERFGLGFPQRHPFDGSFRPVPESVLSEQPLKMGPYGVWREAKLSRNLLVSQASRDQIHDLLLAWREVHRKIGSCVHLRHC
jgi:hypothetical protein